MIQEVNPFQQILSQQCPQHPFEETQLIDLTGSSDKGIICFTCAQEKKISMDNLLFIQELFHDETNRVFSSFPHLKNKEIVKILSADRKFIKLSMDNFFVNLRDDVEKAIKIAEARANQNYIKYEEKFEILYHEWKQMAEMNKFKSLLLSQGDGLNKFLKQKWEEAEENTNKLKKLIDDDLRKHSNFNFEQKREELSVVIMKLRNLDFWNQEKIQRDKMSILKEVNLISSTFQKSQNLTISQEYNSSLQLANHCQSTIFGDAYLNFILHSNKKYVIRLSYNPSQSNSYFLFGLVPDSNKDKEWGFKAKIAYFNQSSYYGLGKYIKGPNINSYQRKNVEETFEVRISLKNREFRVASYPDYSSILEMDDPLQIDPSVPYRFFIHIGNPKDVISINEIIEVDIFPPPTF